MLSVTNQSMAEVNEQLMDLEGDTLEISIEFESVQTEC